MAKTFEERFWRHVAVGGPDDCWPWQGSKGHGGYGRLSVKVDGKTKHLASHRVAWELANKKKLGRRVARHSCDTPPCCNPKHIVPGTQAQNMLDAMERGRLNPTRGEWSPHARLTEAQVVALRDDRAAGMPLAQLSEKYGVSRTIAALVYRGLSWKHVGGPIQGQPAQPAKKLSKVQEAQLIREYEAGVLSNALCSKFNIARGTVNNVLKRHGVTPRSPGHPPGLTEKSVAQVRKMYAQQKMSMTIIAEQFGVSATAVHRAVHGVYAPKHGIV